MTLVGVPSRPLQYLKAVALADLPSGTKATCWAIASFADNDTGKAFPSVRVLAEATGLSGPIVSQHTRRAEEAGFLRKERRHNNSIVYTITTPVLAGKHTVAAPMSEAWIAPIPMGPSITGGTPRLRTWPELPFV